MPEARGTLGADYGVGFCGPSTAWDQALSQCVGVPSAPHAAACPTGFKKDAKGNCVEIRIPPKTCKPFATGVSYVGENVNSRDLVLSAPECAEVCLRDFKTDFFTYAPASRMCVCMNDAHPSRDHEQPVCALSHTPPHRGVNIMCGDTLLKQYSPGSLTKEKDEKNLAECNEKAKQKRWGSCPSHISGETCNVDVSTHCDPSTELRDGKCVAKSVDPVAFCSHGTEAVGGKCVRSAAPASAPAASCGPGTVLVEGKCAAKPRTVPVTIGEAVRMEGVRCADGSMKLPAPMSAKSAAECADNCRDHKSCVASSYSDRTCTLYASCATIVSNDERATALEIIPQRRSPAEACGPGTTYSASSKLCAAPQPQEHCGVHTALNPGTKLCEAPVPASAQLCGKGTLWDKGRCETDPASAASACGAFTTFDAKTGKCSGQDPKVADSLKKENEKLAARIQQQQNIIKAISTLSPAAAPSASK